MTVHFLRRPIAVFAAVLAAAVVGAGTLALADTPGTNVTVSPNSGLADSQNVNVSGTGFATNALHNIYQCRDFGTFEACKTLGTVTTNSSGVFGPTAVTVTKTFVSDDAVNVDCGVANDCTVYVAAVAAPQDDHAPISFASGSTSTTPTTTAPPANVCLSPTIVGTPDNDILLGTPSADVIDGLEGNDQIDGLGGDDTICGGPGDDVIYGRAGNDRVFGGLGRDVVYGGTGNDRLFAGEGDDVISAGDGRDVLNGGGGNDALFGADGNDDVQGGLGDDALDGGNDDDTCDGAAGSDSANECETATAVP